MSGEGCVCFRSLSLCFTEASLCFRAAVQKGCWGFRGCGHPRHLGWIPARDFGHLRNDDRVCGHPPKVGRGPLDCLFWGRLDWRFGSLAWGRLDGWFLGRGRLDWQFAGRSACWFSCWFRRGSACSLLSGGSLDWVRVPRDVAWLRDWTCYAGDGWFLDWGSLSGRGCLPSSSDGGAVVGTERRVLQPFDFSVMERLLMTRSGHRCNDVCCSPHWQFRQSRLEQLRVRSPGRDCGHAFWGRCWAAATPRWAAATPRWARCWARCWAGHRGRAWCDSGRWCAGHRDLVWLFLEAHLDFASSDTWWCGFCGGDAA